MGSFEYCVFSVVCWILAANILSFFATKIDIIFGNAAGILMH